VARAVLEGQLRQAQHQLAVDGDEGLTRASGADRRAQAAGVRLQRACTALGDRRAQLEIATARLEVGAQHDQARIACARVAAQRRVDRPRERAVGEQAPQQQATDQAGGTGKQQVASQAHSLSCSAS
jgi:hypothetical protein